MQVERLTRYLAKCTPCPDPVARQLRFERSVTAKVAKLQDKLSVPCCTFYQASWASHIKVSPKHLPGQSAWDASEKQRGCKHHTLYRLDVSSTGERVTSSIRSCCKRNPPICTVALSRTLMPTMLSTQMQSRAAPSAAEGQTKSKR